MKNIKDKIFTILAAAAMLIGAGTGSGIISNPDVPAIPGVEEGEITPEGSNGNEASTNGDLDEYDEFDL